MAKSDIIKNCIFENNADFAIVINFLSNHTAILILNFKFLEIINYYFREANLCHKALEVIGDLISKNGIIQYAALDAASTGLKMDSRLRGNDGKKGYNDKRGDGYKKNYKE